MLVNTVLPEPLRPKITMVSPGKTSRSTPVSTDVIPKGLVDPPKGNQGAPGSGRPGRRLLAP